MAKSKLALTWLGLTSLAIVAALGYAAWHYHETGRWPLQPPGEYTVSQMTFARILTQMAAHQSIPPAFAAPERIETANTAAMTCGLERQPVTWSRSVLDKQASTATTPAYAVETRKETLLTSSGTGAVVFATADTFAVNVDGSPRAYHPADIYGRCETPASGPDKGKRICAINFLCYAGVRIFQGAREISCGAREDYRRAWDDIWNEIVNARAKPIPRAYWRLSGDEAFARSYGFFHPRKAATVMFKDTIIRQDASGKPCRRDVPGTKYEGYFVAATSLTGNEGAAEREGTDPARIVTDQRCNPIPYVDAETLPNIVIPVGGFAGAKVGDLVVAYRKDAAGIERWVHAIVGDEGPNHKFGEGSAAFNAAIKGAKSDWESYSDIVRNLHISPRDKGAGPVGVLIFKGTGAEPTGDFSPADVARKALEAFTTWGGNDLDKARDRFRACMQTIK